MDGNLVRMSEMRRTTGGTSMASNRTEDLISRQFFSIQSSPHQIETTDSKHRSSRGYEMETVDRNTEAEIQDDDVFPNEQIKMTKENLGRTLIENNEKIVEYIVCLRQHRDELVYLIEKQYKERKKLENEMEKITYKLCLINKSMAQRIKTKNLYDETIKEVESNYCHLIKDSEKILGLIRNRYEKLEMMISNKKTSTDQHLINKNRDEQSSGEQGDAKIFKCPKLKSTYHKLGNKLSSSSNDSLT